MNKSIRHTAGFSCAPGSGFFARCPKDGRLLIFGQTCVCGKRSSDPTTALTALGAPRTAKAVQGLMDRVRELESAPRDVCGACQFEYLKGGEHVCTA